MAKLTKKQLQVEQDMENGLIRPISNEQFLKEREAFKNAISGTKKASKK